MATPPTRVGFDAPASGNYTTTTSPKTSAGLPALQVGDVIVVVAGSEQAGTNAVVTPSCSAGSVTWTLQASQMAGTVNQSGEKLWTGVVGAAAAAGATISLARINTGTTLWWGFTATLWRGVSAVANPLTASSGTSNSIAQATTASLSANSAVQIGINDWNASTIASPSWQTVNGAAMTTSINVTGASHATALGAYRDDVGTAGTKTVGLTTPATLRWVMVGIELLGTSGGTFNGTASSSSTATVTTSGVVGKVTSAALAATVAITAAGVVGTAASSTSSSTASITAAGAVGTSSSASLAATGTITASGTVTSGSTASASLSATASTTTAGVVGTSASASLAATATTTATGSVGRSTTASLAATGTISAAGTVTAGGTASAALAATATITATGVVGRSATASIAATGTITAAGSVAAGPSSAGGIAATDTLTASGVVGARSTTSITLAAQLFASGALGVSRSASLAATATVTATGIVAVPAGVAPDERTLVVEAESRVLVVPAESRVMVATVGDGVMVVPPENRTMEA